MENVLNAIYPPVIILLIGFVMSIILYIFLKLISENIPFTSAIIFSLGWMIVPIISIIELFSIVFLKKGVFTNIKLEKFSLRLFTALMFFPFAFYLLIKKPSKVANYLVNKSIEVIYNKKSKPVVYKDKIKMDIPPNTNDVDFTIEMLIPIIDKISSKMNFRHVG